MDEKVKYSGWLITATEESWTSRFNYDKFDKFMDMIFKDLYIYYCYNEEFNDRKQKCLYIFVEFKKPKRIDYLQNIFVGCHIEPRKVDVYRTRRYIQKENLIGDRENSIKPFKEVGNIKDIVDNHELEENFLDLNTDQVKKHSEFEKLLKFYNDLGFNGVRFTTRDGLESLIMFNDVYLLDVKDSYMLKYGTDIKEFSAVNFEEYEQKLIEFMNEFDLYDLDDEFIDINDFVKVPKMKFRIFGDFLFLRRITNVDFQKCKYISEFTRGNKNVTINLKEIKDIKPIYSKRAVTNNRIKQFLGERDVVIMH